MSAQAPVSVRIITQLQPMTPMPGQCLTQREQSSRSRVGQDRVGQGRAGPLSPDYVLRGVACHQLRNGEGA